MSRRPGRRPACGRTQPACKARPPTSCGWKGAIPCSCKPAASLDQARLVGPAVEYWRDLAARCDTQSWRPSIPPFGDQQPWQAPPYQPGSGAGAGAETPDLGKAEREAMEKSSLIYVRNVSANSGSAQAREILHDPASELGLGLATGTRLRARLESAASTAVRTPVLAVIEYNYERDGEIIVPAGAKAVGHIRNGDRSGYVDIQFDSLLMPDGAVVPIEAAATGLDLRPLKGKVEGKNTGKNVLVRSLSGIGQAGSMLVGQGSLNQPLSESDLMRERVSNNVGEAGDEEVSRLAITQHIVVTISADTPIYVVLEQTPKTNQGFPATKCAERSNIQLRQC